MSKMRTIAEAYNELKAQDENTALTLYALQCLVKSGAIPSISIGRKRLINMDNISGYLQGNSSPLITVQHGQIRKIDL